MSLVHSTAIKGIDNVTYLVQDAQRAKAFYSETLGLVVTTDYGPEGAEFVLSDGSAFGVWKMSDGTFRPGGIAMFAVDDIRSAIDEYTGRGVAFDENGAIEESPVCFMAFASDTEGNRFILHQRK